MPSYKLVRNSVCPTASAFFCIVVTPLPSPRYSAVTLCAAYFAAPSSSNLRALQAAFTIISPHQTHLGAENALLFRCNYCGGEASLKWTIGKVLQGMTETRIGRVSHTRALPASHMALVRVHLQLSKLRVCRRLLFFGKPCLAR